MAMGAGDRRNDGDLLGMLVRQLADLPGISTRAAERIAFHLMAQPVEESEELAATLVEFRRSMRLCPACFQHCGGALCPLCANPNRNHRQICVVEMSADIAAFERSGVYTGSYHVLLGRISPLGGVQPGDLTCGALLARAAGRLGQAMSGGEAAFDAADEAAGGGGAAEATGAEGETGADGASDEAVGGEATAAGDDVPAEAALAGEANLRALVAAHPWLQAPAEEIILATSATAEGETTAAYLMNLLEPLGIAVTRIARGLPIGAEVAFAQRSTLATALRNRIPFHR